MFGTLLPLALALISPLVLIIRTLAGSGARKERVAGVCMGLVMVIAIGWAGLISWGVSEWGLWGPPTMNYSKLMPTDFLVSFRDKPKGFISENTSLADSQIECGLGFEGAGTAVVNYERFFEADVENQHEAAHELNRAFSEAMFDAIKAAGCRIWLANCSDVNMYAYFSEDEDGKACKWGDVTFSLTPSIGPEGQGKVRIHISIREYRRRPKRLYKR